MNTTPTPPLRDGYGLSSPDKVIAHVHPDGRMAITLPFAPCFFVNELDDWNLLGRIKMRNDMDASKKINVLAWHRDTGMLGRFYVINPGDVQPADDYDNDGCPPEMRESLREYDAWFYRDRKQMWDLMSQLPEITDVFIGTPKDLKEPQCPA